MMQGLQYRPGTAGSAPCKKKSAALQLNKPLQKLESPLEAVQRLASENAVLVFSMSSCCMCHVVKRLLCSLGVNPAVCELDEEDHGEKEAQGELRGHREDIEKALVRLVGQRPPVPAVFIGGQLVGGLDRLMAAHISGELVPRLKEAGALWL